MRGCSWDVDDYIIYGLKKEFDSKYKDSLYFKKYKSYQNIFKGIVGQLDGYDLEKIKISTIFNSNKKDYKTLEVQSIFGLRNIQKIPNINYEVCSFYLKQKSFRAEVFDFGIKIKTSTNKQ